MLGTATVPSSYLVPKLLSGGKYDYPPSTTEAEAQKGQVNCLGPLKKCDWSIAQTHL